MFPGGRCQGHFSYTKNENYMHCKEMMLLLLQILT
jgi:hypothetical protein